MANVIGLRNPPILPTPFYRIGGRQALLRPPRLTPLKFTNANANRCQIASAADITNLNPQAVFALVFRDTNVGGRNIFGKGDGATNSRNTGGLATAGAADLRFDMDRGTQDLSYVTSAGVFTPGGWYWVAAVVDTSGPAGGLVQFYFSRLGEPFISLPATTATDGSGAFQSDSGKTLNLGNNSAAVNSFCGDVAYIGLCAAAIRKDELVAIQSNMFGPIRGLRGLWLPGSFGGTNVPDISGLGHHALNIGATISSNVPSLPLVGLRRSRVFTSVTAFKAAFAVGANQMVSGGHGV